MEYPHNIVKFMCAEIADVDKNVAESGRLSINDLEIVCKYANAIKDFDKIAMLEDGDGYSQAGDWEMEGRGSYERGSSYRGRKRDSMGRYSRDGRYSSTGRMYSRADARDGMMAQLEEMMDHASEQERAILRQAMDKLEKV